jgi:dTDP-glucose pyrophosphorylase
MRKIKIGVVPAAGEGTRIHDLPLSRILPKPMLPVLNKPILEYVISNMKNVGIDTIYFIVNYKKEVIQQYFRTGEEFGVDIYYVEQKNPRGIAHAISLTNDLINEPFMVILGDDLTITKSLYNLTELFFKKSCGAVEGVINEKNIDVLKRTCCVFLDKEGKIIDIIEKPKFPKSNIRGCGIYIFDPIVYDYIKMTPRSSVRGEVEITDTIKLMSRENSVFGGFINGININVNTFDDLLLATNILLRKTRGT